MATTRGSNGYSVISQYSLNLFPLADAGPYHMDHFEKPQILSAFILAARTISTALLSRSECASCNHNHHLRPSLHP